MRLRLVTAGESHGPGLVAVVEGLPHGLSVDLDAIDKMLRRRQGGYGRGGRMKIERDGIEVVGGIRHGRTLGSPVAFLLRNRDFANWEQEMSVGPPPEGWSPKKPIRAPRPGHADLAGAWKYNAQDPRDILERASARETAARTAGGAICLQLLQALGMDVRSHVLSIGAAGDPAAPILCWEGIAALPEDSETRCAHPETAALMKQEIDRAREAKDTLGGVFEVVAHALPVGLGSHVHWDRKLDAQLLQAIGSIPAIKAVEIGTGCAAASLRGSQVHDAISREEKKFHRNTNRAGGLEGGITNGEDVRVRGYMKPLSTLLDPLPSVDLETGDPSVASVERSDVCSVPAAAVVAEAMIAYVVANAVLEKFGGDSMAELASNLEAHRDRVESLFPKAD